MSRRVQENLVAALLLCLFLATIYASLDYGPRARLVPIPIAVIGAVFIIGQMVLQNRRSAKDLKINLLELISSQASEPLPVAGGTPVGADAGRQKARHSLRSELQALGLVLLLVALFFLVGPLPTMFLFTTGYFIASKLYSPIPAVAGGAALTVATYLIFVVWLGVDLGYGEFDILDMF